MKEIINLLKHVTGSNEDDFEKLYVSFTQDVANLNDVNILLKLYRESEEVFVKLAQECLHDLQKYTILLQVANLQKAVLGKIFSNEMSIIKIESSAEIDPLLSRFDFSEIKKELDLIYKSVDKAPPPKPGELDQGESSSTQARTEENIKEEHPMVKNCRKAIGRLITIKPTGNPNVLTRINIQNIAILMSSIEKYTNSIFELS